LPSNHGARRDARTLLATWLALVALTLCSFSLADSSSRALGATTWVLGFAALKGLLIASVFMEMRRGPRGWAALMGGFLLAEAALIAAILP
jgi:cytochrome c oxidase subunit IV